MKNILIIAAENSAENYGAQVVAEFQKRDANVHFFGVGGDKLKEIGVELIIHNKELAVVGIIEVVSSIFKLKRCMNLLYKTAIQRKAAAVLLIDYPDFNLRIARKFKKAGIKVYYYISPTVWAWRYSRVDTIKKVVDHLFIIFPFEIPIYKHEEIPFTYTGHPLLPDIKVNQKKADFRKTHGIGQDQLLVSLLPGSRRSEIHFLLPVMLAAMEQLNKEFNIKIQLLKANSIEKELLDTYLEPSQLEIGTINQQEGYDLINASDIVLTTCGTSNLEIAVLGTPFTAVYRVNKLSYFLGKRFVKIKLYSIVNILAGHEVIRELIQHNFTPENVVAELRRILSQPEVRDQMQHRFEKIRTLLTQDQYPPAIIYDKISSDLAASDGQGPF
jgi:lipid-A-disaccharide synthase